METPFFTESLYQLVIVTHLLTTVSLIKPIRMLVFALLLLCFMFHSALKSSRCSSAQFSSALAGCVLPCGAKGRPMAGNCAAGQPRCHGSRPDTLIQRDLIVLFMMRL